MEYINNEIHNIKFAKQISQIIVTDILVNMIDLVLDNPELGILYKIRSKALSNVREQILMNLSYTFDYIVKYELDQVLNKIYPSKTIDTDKLSITIIQQMVNNMLKNMLFLK